MLLLLTTHVLTSDDNGTWDTHAKTVHKAMYLLRSQQIEETLLDIYLCKRLGRTPKLAVSINYRNKIASITKKWSLENK